MEVGRMMLRRIFDGSLNFPCSHSENTARMPPCLKWGAPQSVMISCAGGAPTNFLDHDAVVQLSFPVPHARFEHLGMHREQRQLLLHPCRLLQHEMHVLEVLGDAAFGSEIAAHHLGAFTSMTCE